MNIIMKRLMSIFAVAFVCLSVVSCGGKTNEITVRETEVPKTPEVKSETLMDSMSVEEKVGQILFVRCPEAENVQKLMDKKPGGILMFQRDFDSLTKEQVIEKIEGFQSSVRIPLIIGVDEEGGTVVRVSANPNLVSEKYKSPQQIYKEGGMNAVVDNAHEKSELLLSLGINMNLAPVADVSTNPDTYIYKRSFGQDYEKTAEFISKTVTAMRETGISSVLKHFPGYGEVTGDSHKGSVYNEKSADEIRETDFIPFKAGIDAGASCVLVSHNIVNSLDSDNPASLSEPIHKILRNELDFDGVIMTDDIAMGAVADVENVYVKAVNAGNDLLITTDYETAYNQILSAVKSGEISNETLDNAVYHILKLKNLV